MKTKKILLVSSLLVSLTIGSQERKSPDVIFGNLFEDVQMQRIFTDNKTFVDAIPKINSEKILKIYQKEKKQKDFSLIKFVNEYFTIPTQNASINTLDKDDLDTHIVKLWDKLERSPDIEKEGSSLLSLPNSYIVPGGRFREIYYWDSYFTMLGLEVSKKYDLIENMVNNFDFILKKYGHIPNGNRSYYLSRSQPPFFSLMVELLSESKGDEVYTTYNKALQIEYDYWMDKTANTKHVITLPNGAILNRYWDQLSTPRQESFFEDSILVVGKTNQDFIYRNLRSGAESGWDFSSRWLEDDKDLSTIRCTDILPIDLNCLLYHLEKTLSISYLKTGDTIQSNKYLQLANLRLDAINSLFYNPTEKWYYDYDISNNKQTNEMTIAGMVPFFLALAPLDYIGGVANNVETKFLKPGGVVMTLKNSGQQWDAPNGWAPLQWMTISGLQQYGKGNLAKKTAIQWIELNKKVYNATGKMMEKYNVVDMDLTAGGGEYPAQDGFGWSNGVYLKLVNDYVENK